MARKNLLKGLMDAAPEDEAPKRVDPARPRYAKGAIGAVSQSINALKSRSVMEIDPFQIDAGGVQDRLDHDEAEHQALMSSIRDHGQQVPVLVRPHPEDETRYQIVYGRRRVLALRDLGQPVKAMVRDLDDQALVIAQGQENSARRDLSYIEKAHFARQMREAGYDRKAMMAALHVDKTQISRLLAAIDTIPQEVIVAIGAAPSVGRDRWRTFSDAFAQAGLEVPDLVALITMGGATSDERFDAGLTALTRPARTKSKVEAQIAPPKTSGKTTLRAADGAPIAVLARGKSGMTLTLKEKDADGFDRWLIDNLPDLHARFLSEGSKK